MNPNLEIIVEETQSGLYTVVHGRKEAPLDVQEAAFAAHGLEMVSPAVLGYLRANTSGIFDPYSRTNADVFYDDRKDGQVVIVPGGAISKQVGIANIVAAHRSGKEFIIPEDQKGTIYQLVDTMLEQDVAFKAGYGQINVSTSEFVQNELTSRLFSDERLGIRAEDYGTFLEIQGKRTQSFFFDSEDHAQSQNGPYVTRLRVCGPVGGFGVFGGRGLIDGVSGAFGVQLKKTAEGGEKNRNN